MSPFVFEKRHGNHCFRNLSIRTSYWSSFATLREGGSDAEYA